MTKDAYVFSVVIFTDNDLPKLKACVNSLVKQFFSLDDIEVIICAENIDKKIEYYLSSVIYFKTTYLSLNKKRNDFSILTHALSHSNGKYILLLDDKSVANPSLLVEHQKAHDSDPDDQSIVLGRLIFSDKAQEHPLTNHIYKSNKYNPFVTLNPHSYYKYRYFQSNNISIPKQAINQIIKENDTKKQAFFNLNNIAYLLEKAGYYIYYQPEAIVQNDYIISLDDFTNKQETEGKKLVQLFLKHPELIQNEKKKLGFENFTDANIKKMESYLDSTKDIARLIQMIEKLNQLNIINPNFIPMNDGSFITLEELNTLLAKYLEILKLHFLYKGILAAIKEYSIPKFEEWKINEKPKRKKIEKPRLLLTSYYWGNKMSESVFPYDIANRLVKQGWEVAVLFIDKHKKARPVPYHLSIFYENNVKLYKLSNLQTPYTLEEYPEYEICDTRALERFKFVVNDFKPDLIHFFNLRGLSFEITKLAKERNIPSIYTPVNYHLIDPKLYMMRTFSEKWNNLDLITNTPLFDKYPSKMQLYLKRIEEAKKILNENCTHILAPSDRVKNILIEFGGNKNNISTFHYIPQSTEFIHEENREVEKLKFAYLDRVVPHKGLHKILQACEYLDKDSTEILVFGGAYPKYYTYLEKIDSKKLVKWHPSYDTKDAHSIYQKFDVLIVPNIWEDGANIRLLEALKAGKPVIAADIGGASDFIKDGVNGFLYPPNDERRLAELMLNLIKKPFIHGELQKNCKLDYSFEDMIENLSNVYTN